MFPMMYPPLDYLKELSYCLQLWKQMEDLRDFLFAVDFGPYTCDKAKYDLRCNGLPLVSCGFIHTSGGRL